MGIVANCCEFLRNSFSLISAISFIKINTDISLPDYKIYIDNHTNKIFTLKRREKSFNFIGTSSSTKKARLSGLEISLLSGAVDET